MKIVVKNRLFQSFLIDLEYRLRNIFLRNGPFLFIQNVTALCGHASPTSARHETVCELVNIQVLYIYFLIAFSGLSS